MTYCTCSGYVSGKTEKDGILLVKMNLLSYRSFEHKCGRLVAEGHLLSPDACKSKVSLKELRVVLTFVLHNSTVLALEWTLSYKSQIDLSGKSKTGFLLETLSA